MTPQLLNELAITPALSLLPERMDSREARVMLVCIALQESALKYRQQVLRHGRRWWEWRGPARGYWQFEPTGLRGVLTHRASRGYAAHVMTTLGYDSPASMMPVWLSELHGSLKHNDTLAASMARLLLWTLPRALPTDADAGFAQYLDSWRPGAWFRGDSRERNELRHRWGINWQLAQEAIA